MKSGHALLVNYVEGLEEDGERIFEYFMRDFVFTRKNKSPVPFWDSTGDSFRSSFATSEAY